MKAAINRLPGLPACLAPALMLGWILSAVPPAPAQTEAQSEIEKQLLERIEELESRLRRLEIDQRLAPSSGADLTSIDNRLTRLELEQGGKTDDNTLRAYWSNGLRLDSADGAFKLKLGGRIQNDWAWFVNADEELEDEVGNLEDGTEIRRARFYVSGTLYDNVEFKTQYDFAKGEAEFKDVYLGLLDLPFGNLRVGQFQEPFSLEELTSNNYLTFLERASLNAFAPSRSTGLMAYDSFADERATWAVGGFRGSDAFGKGSSDGDYNVTARATGLPLYDEGGTTLLHLGLAATQRNPANETLRYQQRPESHLAPLFVDTGEFEADSALHIGLEAALVLGASSLQSEYVMASPDTPGNDPEFSAYYVQASHFLTGEHRPYSRSTGAFGRVEPKRNFLTGGGAWEIAARFSGIDLTDQAVEGGEMQNLSAALNWYLNPNTRVLLDYVLADLEDVGDTDIVQTRFQVDF